MMAILFVGMDRHLISVLADVWALDPIVESVLPLETNSSETSLDQRRRNENVEINDDTDMDLS